MAAILEAEMTVTVHTTSEATALDSAAVEYAIAYAKELDARATSCVITAYVAGYLAHVRGARYQLGLHHRTDEERV